MTKARLLAALSSFAPRISLVFLLCLCTSALFAADRYWVATGSGNWSNTANWSASSGGAGGASVPNKDDRVIFNSAGNGNCTIDAEVIIIGLIVGGTYGGTIDQGAFPIQIGNGGASLSGGNFVGGTKDITVLGTFSISGTNFTSTRDTLRIGADYNFSITTGTFAHNNGTVKLIVRNNSITNSLPGNLTFHNLNIHNTYGTSNYTINSGNGLIVNGTFSLSGEAATSLNTGMIDIKGDIVVTSTSGGGSGNATLQINGTGIQTISGNSVQTPGKLPKVIIDKASGQLNLIGSIAAGNDWTYKKGIINAGTSRMIFSGNFKITGTQTFYDIEFNALDRRHDIIIESLTELTATHNIYYSGTSSIFINTGIIHVKGNIIVENSSDWGGGDATIMIDGSDDQTITGTISPYKGLLPGITINKPLGTLHFENVITVSSHWTYTTGILDVGTSKVVFLGDLKISGSHSLYDVDFRGPDFIDTYIYFSSGTVLTVTGHTYITGSHEVILNAGTIVSKGDITVTNTGIWTGGEATILINGPGLQTLTGAGLINRGSLPRVNIEKPSNTTLKLVSIVSVANDWIYTAGIIDAGVSTVNFETESRIIDAQGTDGSIMNFYNVSLGDAYKRTLQGKINIMNTLALGNGRIDLNGYTCYIDRSSPDAVTRSSNGYIISDKENNSSKLSWNLGSFTGSYTYPFATKNEPHVYIPFVFELTNGDAGVVTVSTYGTWQQDNKPYPSMPDPVTNMSYGQSSDFSSFAIDRFWQIDKTGASGTANVTYTYAPSEVTGGVVGKQNLLYAQRYNKLTNTWDNPRASQTANGASNSVTESGITQFSPRMLSVHTNVLPVILQSFAATYNNKVVEVKWSTSSEKDHDHFVIERSADGRVFETVTILKGRGNSNVISNYSIMDNRPLSGISYYRIKIVDLDGKTSYSAIAKVNGEKNASLVKNSIANGTLYVMSSGINKNNWIRIFDAGGRLVYQKLYDGSGNLDVSTSGWSKGVYTITAGSLRSRFIVQ